MTVHPDSVVEDATYWNEDYGYGGGQVYAAYKACTHDGSPVQLMPGAQLYAYSSRSTKGLPDVDYFIALSYNWTDDGDGLLMAPGVPFMSASVTSGPKYIYLATPDHGVIRNIGLFIDLVEWAVEQALGGKRVGVGCMGGHGRTGTFLSAALLAANPTWNAKEAVEFLRAQYCKDAVESESQVDLLVALAEIVWTDKPKVADPVAQVKAYLAKQDADREVERKAKAVSYTMSGASLNTGPYPKRVRIKTGLPGGFLAPMWGLEVAVESWGYTKGAVVVRRPDGGTASVFPVEYDVTVPADEPKGKSFSGRWIRCTHPPYTEYQVLRVGYASDSVIVLGITGGELEYLASEYEFIAKPTVKTFPGKIMRVIKP